jgi:hypothetical protein
MVVRLALGSAVAAAFLVAATGGMAGSTYDERVLGTELPPITSTLGTFAGVAAGRLPGEWRVRIYHERLRASGPAAITGGWFTMRTLHGRMRADVVGGSVSPVKTGGTCGNQVFAVHAVLSDGSFDGTLIHHRRSVFGRCVIYVATISGQATFVA